MSTYCMTNNNVEKVLQIARQFRLDKKTASARKLHQDLVRLILDTPVPGMNGNRKTYREKRLKYIMRVFGVKETFELMFFLARFDDAQNTKNKEAAVLMSILYDKVFKKLPLVGKLEVIRRLPPAVLTAISNKVPNSTKTYVANVTTYMNANMMPVNRANINNTNLAFIVSNIDNTQKIRTVYDRKGLLAWLNKSKKSPKTQPSPMTRKMFNADNIMNFSNK